MNRIELVGKIAAEHGLSRAEAGSILETITKTIVDAVSGGDCVTLAGFGTFRQVARAERAGFNPQSGERIRIAAQKMPKFVPGAAFKTAVDPDAAARRGKG